MIADGKMLAARGPGTRLPSGFAGLLVHTNSLHCLADEQVSTTAQRGYPEDAAQLLCRALRLAPSCYCHFQLAHDRPDRPLKVSGRVWLAVGNRQTLVECPSAEYADVAELAAAMQQYTSAEGLSLYVAPQYRSIIIRRTGDVLPAWHCQCEAESGHYLAGALQTCHKCVR